METELKDEVILKEHRSRKTIAVPIEVSTDKFKDTDEVPLDNPDMYTNTLQLRRYRKKREYYNSCSEEAYDLYAEKRLGELYRRISENLFTDTQRLVVKELMYRKGESVNLATLAER